MTDIPSDAPSTPAEDADDKGERIAKRLARAGLCSRRDAERWIAEGRVSVDGKVLSSPALVVTEQSRILVDGKPIPEPERSRLWRYHKPSGLVTSHKDPQGRPTVFERLPEDMPRVISVGRLDLNSEGLLLLTNDGELARRLELPSTGWVRRYRVRIHGTPDVAQLASLEKGITVDGISYGPIKALLDRQQGSNAWLTVSLKEGKNREIRRVMDHLGWSVSRLIRVAYGPFQLGLLEEGQVDEVPSRVIKEQLGGKGSQKPVGTATAHATDKPGIGKSQGVGKPGAPRPNTGKATSSRENTSSSRKPANANRRRPS
ncbi:MAG: rRNA pseudouridine synthase [Telmatospirillum sp.]|nr:rRNA pseudouridine synthase [Telmatospirillum sp.]